MFVDQWKKTAMPPVRRGVIALTVAVTAAALALVSVAGPGDALAAGPDRFVSISGDDAGACGVSAPCETLSYALDGLAGGTLHLSAGEFPAT